MQKSESLAASSLGRLQVTVYEIGLNRRHTMGELSGQTVARFDLDRDKYFSNQTVCMGYSRTSLSWRADLCQSELFVEAVQIKCTCNAFDSNMIGVFTDFTRKVGEKVTFPEPEVDEDNDEVKQFAVVPSNVDPSLLDGVVTERNGGDMEDEEIHDGTNYVWMAQTILVALLTLIGSLIALKRDKKDDAEQGVSRTWPISIGK